MADLPRQLRSISTLAGVLASYGEDALAPYADDVDEAHEGLIAVLDHLPSEPPRSSP